MRKMTVSQEYSVVDFCENRVKATFSVGSYAVIQRVNVNKRRTNDRAVSESNKYDEDFRRWIH